jgi:hypothetical protein
VHKPHFILLVETWLRADAINPLIPKDYKVVVRLDRTVGSKGGGLLVLAQKHLLVDKLALANYNTPCVAEIVGYEFEGTRYILSYTPNSALAPKLFTALENYALDNPERADDTVYLGDFNAHNPELAPSDSPLDVAGVAAQNFATMFGLRQHVNFPTRGGNTLDYVFSTGCLEVSPGIHIGNSDHISLHISRDTRLCVPEPPDRPEVYQWDSAPWDHIKGHLKRELVAYRPVGCHEAAESQLNDILERTIGRYVKKRKPVSGRPARWWTRECDLAFANKLKANATRLSDPGRLKSAISRCRRVQKAAFKRYQNRLRVKLSKMSNSSSEFWRLSKEIGGIDADRTTAAPSAEALVGAFAAKMANAKGEEDIGFKPRDAVQIPLSGFKIRFKKVRDMLRKMDASKSANGIPPRFWKECADTLAPAVTRLFKLIVKRARFITRWKRGRVSAPHKRGSVKDPLNYRPLTVLENISLGFEEVIGDQLESWLSNFIPRNQFGFTKATGTSDYGALLTMKMTKTLDARLEGILISLDVKGAFDRVWWGRLKARLRAKGMRGRALKLLKNYLDERFIQVVVGGDRSSLQEIFSGVPQGAKWSPALWNFDISEMPEVVGLWAMLICYADDCALWYEITEFNRSDIITVINADLDALVRWGDDNKTLFEPSKTVMMVVSRKRLPFDPTGINMLGTAIKHVSEMKLVGFMFDEKLTWGPMIDLLVRKARVRIGALYRMSRMLDCDNIRTMYVAFIRSVLEFGSVQYMGAAATHLAKLDSIQAAAERIGGFKMTESLGTRREAALLGLTFKLLDGAGRGDLQFHAPLLEHREAPHHGRLTRNTSVGLRIKDTVTAKSLECYKRGAIGALPKIWDKIPQELLMQGEARGWQKITKKCKGYLRTLD